MDDRFLFDLRREPAPEFSRRLRARLRDDAAAGRAYGAGRQRVAKWASMAASVAVVGLAFTMPSVRAGAQAFLDLFRIANFVGVSFDDAQLSALDAESLGLHRMIGDQVEVLTEPGPPRSYETLDEAGSAAGLDVLEPAWLPVGWERAGIEVIGEHAVRIEASTASLQILLDQLGIDDVTVPAGLDGQSVTVRVPPVVRTIYRNDDREVQMLQARSPEVSFPADVELPVLAEIGLRILGLGRDEASRLAWTIDWRSTLLVPVPASAAAFREVDVAGRQGLLIEPAQRSGISVLLWASDDRVLAISGTLWSAQLLEMAQTAQ